MLRTQTKKQSSFYVCASCRRQHQHDLAQLRSLDRIRSPYLSSTSRPLTSTSTTLSRLPPSKTQRNGTALHGALWSTSRRVHARGYAAWGRFGSQPLPGQTNASWGAPLKSNQSAGTPSPSPAWGGAIKIPSVTGTSAWGGPVKSNQPGGASSPSPTWGRATKTPSPATATSAWGRAGAMSSVPAMPAWSGGASTASTTSPFASAPRSVAPRQTNPYSDSPPIPSQPSATPTMQAQSVDTSNGGSQRSTASVQPKAQNKKSDSTSSQLPSTPWTKNAPGAFPPPSTGIAGKPTFGGPAGFIPGKPIFGGSSAWTPVKTTPFPSNIPAKGASAASEMIPLKSTNVHHAAINDQKDSTEHPPASSDTRLAASKPWSRSRVSDPIPDVFYTKSPVRQPPPGAEFPQLQRRSSRDDMFESMSPFKLPSKKEPTRLKAPSPGSPQIAVSRQSPSQTSAQNDMQGGQLPRGDSYSDSGTQSRPSILGDRSSTEASKGGGSGLSRVSTSVDQFELMRRAAITKEKKIKDFDQSGWDDSPNTTGSSQPPHSNTDQDINLPDSVRRRTTQSSQPTRSITDQDMSFREGARRGRAPESEITSRGRGKGSGRENRDFKGRGRDNSHNFEPDENAYAARDKANKRRKFGGDRRQNADENEGSEDFDAYQEMKAMRKQRQQRLEEKRAAEEAAAPRAIRLPEYITVYDLAEALRIKPANFLHDLEQLGFENILHDSIMTGETAALVAAEYGFDPTVESGANVDLRPRPPPEDTISVPPRPPIVTIMGHVDHGKTTILDTLRKSSIVAQEFGGITQHIGAFSVKLSMGKIITFLDTPGHAAFLTMRQRGANVTDIVVLVVAVDDSVKPQTIEAIKHAQSAKVPMIVAINKIDVDNTPNRIDMVKQDLANHGVEIEDYGGDVQAVAISGKTGQGMRELEDAILTLSEVLDMRAETDGMAEGWVLEASIKSDGRAATILVKRGTLRIGDLIVAGAAYTKVRIMRNEAGVDVEEAGPGTPVEIYGSWKGEPMAGDMVLQAPDEPKAQAAVGYRQEIAERAIAAAQHAEREAQDREKAEREALKKRIEEAGESEVAEAVEVGPKFVGFIVKGDVMGSVEAVSLSIQEIGNNEVRPRILRSSPGQITESDVDHMATAKGAIVNFNNPIPGHILLRADKAGVAILDHNIIYETVEAVKGLLSAQLPPIYNQRVLAEAQVAQIFPINITKRKYKNIAGVKVTNGKVTRGGQYRVMRNGEQVYKGKLVALKQNKDDVTEVRNGIECGMMFDEYDDFQEGDLIQLYEDIEQKRYL